MTKRRKRVVGVACAALGVSIMAAQAVSSHPWQLGVLVGLALFITGWQLFTDRRPERARPFDREE